MGRSVCWHKAWKEVNRQGLEASQPGPFQGQRWKHFWIDTKRITVYISIDSSGISCLRTWLWKQECSSFFLIHHDGISGKIWKWCWVTLGIMRKLYGFNRFLNFYLSFLGVPRNDIMAYIIPCPHVSASQTPTYAVWQPYHELQTKDSKGDPSHRTSVAAWNQDNKKESNVL